MFKDKAGYELQPGDYIVYALRVGDQASMDYGVVLENRGKTVSVQGVWQNWKGVWALKRKSVVTIEERVLRLKQDQVPMDVWDLLNPC